MKSIPELQDELSHKIRSAQDIKDKADKANRALTTEETTFCKELLNEGASLKAQIKSLQDQEALFATIDGEVQALAKPDGRKTAATEPSSSVPDEPRIRVVPTHQRIGGLKAFTAKSFGGSQEQASLGAYKSAMWMAATLYNNRNADKWMRDHVGHDWRNAHSIGVNTEGGYLVPEEMSATIIDLREQYGVFRQFTRVRPMASDTLKIPRKAGRWAASWTPEATALTQSSTTFDQVQLVVNKLGGYALISTELAEDAVVSIVDELVRDMGIGLALAEDQAAFIGDGTPTYGGIVGLKNKFIAGTSAGAIDAVAGHDTFAEIDNVDITKMMGALPDYARMNAKIFCSRQFAATVFGRLKAIAGGNNIQTLQGSIWGDYLGVPVVISQVIESSTGVVNDVPVCYYGDLSMSSSLGERRGVTVKRSDEIKFLEDQIALKITERIDILHHDVGDASTAGALVALMANT